MVAVSSLQIQLVLEEWSGNVKHQPTLSVTATNPQAMHGEKAQQ